MTSALTERKNREKAAVAMTDEDEKKDAIKASVEAYKHQAKAAQTTLAQARKQAWQTFENDIKKCRELETENEDHMIATSTEDNTAPVARTMMKKSSEEPKEIKSLETKSLKETIKSQFESLKSLFN
jgi:hypothetical protein